LELIATGIGCSNRFLLHSGNRARVVRSVNSEMVIAYWHIGREIVEHLQDGSSTRPMPIVLVVPEPGRWRAGRLLTSCLAVSFGGVAVATERMSDSWDGGNKTYPNHGRGAKTP
jgi:hypothetical protein